MSTNLFIRMAGVDKSNVYRDKHLSQSEFVRRHINPSLHSTTPASGGSRGRSNKPPMSEQNL
jgi:hypothetical protein